MNFDSIASIVYSKKYCLSLEKTSLLFTVTIEDGAIESKASVFKLLFYCTPTPSTIEKNKTSIYTKNYVSRETFVVYYNL